MENIDTTFKIGQCVSLVVNPEIKGQITGIKVSQTGVEYEVCYYDDEIKSLLFFDFEIEAL